MPTPVLLDGTPPEFSPGTQPLLLCPGCGFEYTHITHVYINTNASESVVRVATADGWVEHVHPKNATPDPKPGDRNVLSLTGWCEGCHETFVMSFLQHRGHTITTLRNQPWSIV